MRALVVYESMYGNTRDVAEAVAEGLAQADFAVETTEVGDAPTAATALGAFDLLVAGGPTHAFSMSRASTREDAAAKGHGPIVSTGIGLREWIQSLEPTAGVAVATFDTRVRHPRVPGSAARSARKHLRQQGFRAVDPATTFWVDGMEGPLLEGELDRARTWGQDLGAEIRTHQALPR